MAHLQECKSKNCSKAPLRAKAKHQYRLGRQEETRYKIAEVITTGPSEQLQNAHYLSIGLARVWVGCERCRKWILIAVGGEKANNSQDSYSLALVRAQVSQVVSSWMWATVNTLDPLPYPSLHQREVG